jgi:hypothetical protein
MTWTATDEGVSVTIDQIGIGRAHEVNDDGVSTVAMLRVEIDGNLYDLLLDTPVAEQLHHKLGLVLDA